MLAGVLLVQLLAADGCGCCCCSWGPSAEAKPDEGPKAEVPPPSAKTPPAPVDTLVSSTLASGRLADVVHQLPDGEQRTRLASVLEAMQRRGDTASAVRAVYGPDWAKHPLKGELTAVLVGHDARTRHMLASASRADVALAWPDGPDTVATDSFRTALSKVLPTGAIDDGVAGWRLEHRLTFVGESKAKNGLIEGTSMKSYEFTGECVLYDERGEIVVQYPDAINALGISPHNARESLRRSDRIAQELAGHVVDHILTEIELSLR